MWVVTLKGNRQPLNASPDYSRGTFFLAATQNGSGTRLAIHLSHLKPHARDEAQKQGLRLYKPHLCSAEQRQVARAA
jgi:hypothetical protein